MKNYLQLIFLILCGCSHPLKKEVKADLSKTDTTKIDNSSKPDQSSYIDKLQVEVPKENIWVYDTDKKEYFREYRDDLISYIVDTIFSNNTHLTITRSYQDSFITDEWTQEDTIYRVSYYDLSYNLLLKEGDQVIIDTSFNKSNIINPADSSFAQIAQFHGYWINRIDTIKNNITLYGTICKPDTDWCLFFNHIIDLKTGNIEFVVPEQEEI